MFTPSILLAIIIVFSNSVERGILCLPPLDSGVPAICDPERLEYAEEQMQLAIAGSLRNSNDRSIATAILAHIVAQTKVWNVQQHRGHQKSDRRSGYVSALIFESFAKRQWINIPRSP